MYENSDNTGLLIWCQRSVNVLYFRITVQNYLPWV